MTTAKEFFKRFPKAEVCYVVDGQVFHAAALGSAKDFARSRATKVVEAFNPAYAPIDTSAADTGAAVNGATTHDGEGKAKSRSAKDKAGKTDAGDGGDAGSDAE